VVLECSARRIAEVASHHGAARCLEAPVWRPRLVRLVEKNCGDQQSSGMAVMPPRWWLIVSSAAALALALLVSDLRAGAAASTGATCG